MASIFLSYAREDRSFAEKLARVLVEAGHSVWWDRRISGGEEFTAEIEAELDKSDIVLVAWSKESVKSRWVRDEAAVGGDRGILVPVSIDGSLPPMGFRQFHTLDLGGWKGSKRDERTAELLRSVERRLTRKRKDTVATIATEPKRRFAPPSGKPFWAIAGAMVLLIAVGVALLLWTGRLTRRGPPSKPTIALLQFTTASPDAGLRQIAAQARESISHTLSKTGVPVRLVGSATEARRSADFLLSGEVSKSGDEVTATVHLDEADQGVTVSTQRIEAAGDDVRNLPERIAVHIAAFFNGSNLMIMDRRHPMDPALMAELLSGSVGDFIGNYQLMKRIVAKAPDEPSALTGLAFFTGLALAEIPRDERAKAVVDARRATEKASRLVPESGDAYAAWCYLHSETRLAECEDRLRAGGRIDPDEPWLREFLAELMQKVGRFDEAAALTNLAFTRNPYDFFMIRPMLRTLEFKADAELLNELVPQAERWYPGAKASFFRNRLYGLLNRADFEAIQRLEKEVGAEDLQTNYIGSEALVAALKSKSKPALGSICAGATREDYLLAVRCMIAFATIGDLGNAYTVAEGLYPRRVGRTPAETERIWLDAPDGGGPLDLITSPGAARMRRDPRYLALVQRTGLLAYWRSGRPPDFCREQPEPICKQLLGRK